MMDIDINIDSKSAAKVIEHGILGAVKWVAGIYSAVILGAALIIYAMGGDSTDGAQRSNMKLHTDSMTGCQYLSVSGGGITPRLDANGKQICSEVRP